MRGKCAGLPPIQHQPGVLGGGPLWRDRLEQAERRWALQAALLEAFKPKDAGGQVLGAGLVGLRRAHGPGEGEGG